MMGAPPFMRRDEPAPLVVLEERAGTRPIGINSRLGLYHFAILLPDRAALGRFLAHLASTGTRIGSSDHLVSEALYLRDPDGLGIEVYRDRPRSEWQMANGELAMASIHSTRRACWRRERPSHGPACLAGP
jgi:catechol 2,3-dioxygenase